MTGFEPVTPSLPRKYSTPELHRLKGRAYMKKSGRPGSNRPPSAWKADALPNELLPLNFLLILSTSGESRIRTCERII